MGRLGGGEFTVSVVQKTIRVRKALILTKFWGAGFRQGFDRVTLSVAPP